MPRTVCHEQPPETNLTTHAAARLRSIVKQVVLWAYINLVRPIPRRYLSGVNRQRIVVLLYHRVNDEQRDAVTVSIKQFEEQMAWIGRHCHVADINDIVRGTVPRDTARPVVVVTFDDGYADNYQNAVPILRRYAIPASFFVSTGMVGTDTGFHHDHEKLGYALSTLNWDQLRAMKAMGFTIGSHTVSHINCGSSDIDEVRRELIESRDTLREKLGLRDLIFAYPFGGREDMTVEVLEAVKQAGYMGSLSAYGGIVSAEIDAFDVPRNGISHGFSLLAFRARLEGFSRQ